MIFNVRIDGEDEVYDWKVVDASSSREAAERYVAHHEQAHVEFPVAGGRESLNVIVRWGANEPEHFEVTGRSEPVYVARRIGGRS